MVVSLKTDLRFPIPGQQGYGDRIIHPLLPVAPHTDPVADYFYATRSQSFLSSPFLSIQSITPV